MAELGKTYESVCSEDGKSNQAQPYMWLGIEDDDGSGRKVISSWEWPDLMSNMNAMMLS